MKNINIQTLREMIKDKDYDVQFYADYWTYLPEDEEFQQDRENESEYQSNCKDCMENLPDDVEQHDPFQIRIDEWSQVFDDSLDITVSDYNYDQECMTIECTLNSSDGTYVLCYIGLDNSSAEQKQREEKTPITDEETRLIIEAMLKDYPDELKKFSF